MFYKFFFPSKFSVGIEFGDTELAIVALTVARKHLTASITEHRKILPQEDREQQMLTYLKEIAHDKKIKSRNVHLAVPALHVIRKEISFPTLLNDTDVKMQLALQQEKHFPGIKEKLEFDFTVAAQQEDIKNERKLVVYATKSSVIAQQAKILQHIGMKFSSIEPDSFAWCRLLKLCDKLELAANEISILVIYHKNRIVMFDNYDILYEQEATEGIRDNLLLFIKQTINNFQLTYSNYKFNKIYILGATDMCIQPSLDLDLPVINIDPFSKITMLASRLSEEDKLNLLLALGLALRDINDCN
jgi:Tfp pilus assembly PilM family ATPase